MLHPDPHQPLDVEVGRRTDATEPHRDVGQPNVQRVRVVIGVHRDGAETQVGSGPKDPNRDLPPVDDEQSGHEDLLSDRLVCDRSTIVAARHAHVQVEPKAPVRRQVGHTSNQS